MIEANWIDYWANQYDENYDDEVLHQVGPRVRGRRYYDREDLLIVGRWKSRSRTRSRLQSNTDEEIRDITRMALEAPLPYRHREGVQVPTASAR